ncbi:NAD(P)-dependent oxidoreductase [Streptomyces sp. NPDC032940]|uniref:NAD-dependent epimerase/dehydratase family protein n=1 Tax=Streptomyces sp. NPDC032940 TaxID=3155366 RepID=UPI0033F4B5C9
MRTLLVTGGNGYVGTVLTAQALAQGWRVFTLDTRPRDESPLPPGDLTEVAGDIRTPEEWSGVLRHVDHVVHLAAVVGDPACGADPDTAWETNYLATVRLAEACHRHDIRELAFASTCSNYGVAADHMAHTWSPVAPQSVYAKSKVFAEHHLLSARDRGLRARILRFSTLYGWSPRMRFDLVVNRMTADATWDGVINLVGGEQWRPFLHVRDAAGVALASLTATCPELIHNCGVTSENYRIADVARMVGEAVPQARLLQTPGGSDRRDYRVDFDGLEKSLGFRPGWTVSAGIREIVGQLRSSHGPTGVGGMAAVMN